MYIFFLSVLEKLIIGSTKGFIRGKTLSTEGHAHAASDIVSGVLPASRGGTGYTSLSALKTALGIGASGTTFTRLGTKSLSSSLAASQTISLSKSISSCSEIVVVGSNLRGSGATLDLTSISPLATQTFATGQMSSNCRMSFGRTTTGRGRSDYVMYLITMNGVITNTAFAVLCGAYCEQYNYGSGDYNAVNAGLMNISNTSSLTFTLNNANYITGGTLAIYGR